VFQGGKDGAAVKHLVASYSPTQLQRAALAAWRSNDRFQLKQATTITGLAGIVQQVLATPEQVRLEDRDYDRNGRFVPPAREHRESDPTSISAMLDRTVARLRDSD